MSGSRHIPLSTYRLQFNRNFTFRRATELVPYLSDLGISHCYASPILKARPGSSHGYDIVDHNCLNPEIGTDEEFNRFVAALHRHDMGLIVDTVPNHMGIMGSDNSWWLDVLENGQASGYARFFDIDWEPFKEDLRGKVLVPVLGEHYGTVLERGELKLTFDAAKGEFSICYFIHRFPIDPREYPRILTQCLDVASAADKGEFQSLIDAFASLPARTRTSPQDIASRAQNKELYKKGLAELCARSPEISSCLEKAIEKINGVPNQPDSFEEMHELIRAQAFRLADWRVAIDEINYRRFFDINDLAALRMEDEAVFEATHRFLLSLIGEGKVDGLRIDHPDGLYDPAQYFERLRSGFVAVTRESGTDEQPCRYLVIEKILLGSERLRRDWPVHGTTGYDFVNLLNGVFVNRQALRRVDSTYRSFIGDDLNFEDLAYHCRRLIIRFRLASELAVLANRLSRIASSKRHTCDFTLNTLREALIEVVACFPVYRTYITASNVSSEDVRYINLAVLSAKQRSRAGDLTIFDFLREVLLTRISEGKDQAYRDSVLSLAMKAQQFTSPVMAKGMEDTTFYRFNRLASLCEVGGDPGKFGTSTTEFHTANKARMLNWRHSMLTTTTHDTKRSEDARARINVLSEVPALWRLKLRQWKKLNEEKKQNLAGAPAPTANDEYLFYQTLLGVWPPQMPKGKGEWRSLTERVEQYMIKAIREAKENSSWINPNVEYEGAISAFVNAALSPGVKNRFLKDFIPAQRFIARLGAWNSLSQTLLKLTSPGVPDTYQGSELWDFRLVDPDNRRPVDYEIRRKYLRQMKRAAAAPLRLIRSLLADSDDGRVKLYLIWKVLRLRRVCPDLFQLGDYVPLRVAGVNANHVLPFARKTGRSTAVVIAPRLLAELLGNDSAPPLGQKTWKDTRIDLPANWPTAYVDVFTGAKHQAKKRKRSGRNSLALAQILGNFPVALLTSGT